MKFSAKFFAVFIISVAINQGYSQYNQNPRWDKIDNDLRASLKRVVTRAPFTMKESFPKDFPVSSTKRDIIKMQSRVSSAEHSMDGITRGVEALINKTSEMESSLVEQNILLEKLDKGFEDMERVLSTHKDVLEDVMNQIGPNDQAFAISNQTCGEVLFARSGSIIYSKTETYQEAKQLHCIWTIQAGHFSQIKITLHDLNLPVHLKLYAVELVPSYSDSAPPHGSGHFPVQAIRTKLLTPTIPQFLEGPVTFIILARNNSDMVKLNSAWAKNLHLFLEYEGRGKLRQKRTQFFHHQLGAYDGSGGFSEGDLETWMDKGLENYFNEDSNYGYNFTRNFGTVVLANFSTKVNFKLELDRGECNNSFFMVIPDLLKNGSSPIDLCKTISSSWQHAHTIYGTPVAFLVGRSSDPFTMGLPFKVKWEADNPYPSNYYGGKCGGILGGTGGKLFYTRSSTAFNESIRCVWVISPQPEVRSHIAIRGVQHHDGIVGGSTSLTLFGLTDMDGNALPSINKVNLLIVGVLSSVTPGWMSFPLIGREIYIVFKSDPGLTPRLRYFSLEWAVTGAIKNGRDMSPSYTLLQDDTGTLTGGLEQTGSPFPSPYHVFILSRPPKGKGLGSILPEMKLRLNQTLPVVGHDDNDNDKGDCFDKSIEIFTLKQGTFQRALNAPSNCKNPGNVVIDEVDGIAVTVMKLDNHTDSIIALDYEWEQGAIPKDNCGGVITGTSGILNYKPGRKYEGNERCIWLMHTPNCSSISLTLLRNGFYGVRYLVVNMINPITGRLRNESLILSSRTPSQTIYSEELLVLLFQTINGTTSGTGFSLQYSGHQCGNNGTRSGGHPPPIHYHLQHFGSSHHNFSYKRDHEGARPHSEIGDLYVIAYSEQVGSHTDVYAKSTIVDFNGGTFHRNAADLCTYDSIRFYGGNERNDPTFHNLGHYHVWEERLTYPEEGKYENGSSCPQQLQVPRRANAFRSEFLALLVIYRVGADSGEVEFLRKNNSSGLSGSGSNIILAPVTNAPSSEEDDWFGDYGSGLTNNPFYSTTP